MAIDTSTLAIQRAENQSYTLRPKTDGLLGTWVAAIQRCSQIL